MRDRLRPTGKVGGPLVVCVLLAALWAGWSGAGAASARQLPVSYDFFAGARAELVHPGGSLPGSNDYTCRSPGKAPVILVHGTGGNRQTNWATLVPILRNAGFCVFALTYGTLPGSGWPVSALGGLSRMEQSAVQLRSFVDRVRTTTGATKVDIVGHSEGTLMPTYYLKYLDGARYVNRYISLAPYWKGQDSSACIRATTVIGSLGIDPDTVWPYPQCAQEQYGSSFMRAIWADGSPYVDSVTYTNIMSRTDGIVVPYRDGDVPGPHTTNIVVQDGCPADRSDHLSIVANPRSARMVLNALDPARARSVPCLPVAPALP